MGVDTQNNILFEVREVSKNFGPTIALDRVSFSIKRGEIRGLIGENGSGKSTVSSIIAGIQAASGGEMYFDGKPWKPATMLQAQENGIGMIVQESGTIRNISIAENIFLGHEELFRQGLFIRKGSMIKEARKILSELGLEEINPALPARTLDIQDCKLIELAKLMYWKPKLFIVDETTTALSQKGRSLLYTLIKKIRDAGNSVLFISHDLDELVEYCDAITILRDGVVVAELDKADYDMNRIKHLMVGRELKGNYYRDDTDGYSDEVVLKADCITTMKDLLCLSMELHKGEILGIGGLSDCGMHTLGRALFGDEEVVDGQVLLPGKDITVKNSEVAVNNKIGYVSKNRDEESLGLGATIWENIASTGYKRNNLLGALISFNKEKTYVRDQINGLKIKCASMYHEVNTLSGGNKQKVVFGKWIAAGTDILILDCPTRGVDIGVKAAMYQLMHDMKKEGKSIVMISEELPELIGMSDRILIMRNGEFTHEAFRSDGITEQDLIEYII